MHPHVFTPHKLLPLEDEASEGDHVTGQAGCAASLSSGLVARPWALHPQPVWTVHFPPGAPHLLPGPRPAGRDNFLP